MTLGDIIRAQRVGLGLTLRDVEDRLSGALSNAYLSQIENGRAANPTIRVLSLIAGALGLGFHLLCDAAREEQEADDA